MPKDKAEDKPKRPRGRPRIHDMPERIDASPDEIAEVILKMPPKSDWRYIRERDSAKSK